MSRSHEAQSDTSFDYMVDGSAAYADIIRQRYGGEYVNFHIPASGRLLRSTSGASSLC